jgi:hypothetical protein
MYPAGALMVAQAIQEQRLRTAERRRRRNALEAAAPGDDGDRRDAWTAILTLPRFGTANAKG